MTIEALNFISRVLYPEDLIHNANYIFFDPTLWSGAHEQLTKRSIPYHLIGRNVFKVEAETPTLIELNELSQDVKEQLWVEIGSYNLLNAFSKFDQMSMFQNYIISKSNLDQIKKFLADFMCMNVQGENYLFRYFDPRVLIHLNAIFDIRFRQSLKQQRLFLEWKKHIQAWSISISGDYFQLNFPYEGNNANFSEIGFDEVININEYLRFTLTPQYDDQGELVKSEHEQPFETLLNITYEKALGEKHGFK